MREGALLEGPGTGAKSSCSQRTTFFCPVKSPPGSGGEGGENAFLLRPFLRTPPGGRGQRGPGAGPARHLSLWVLPKGLFPDN